MTSHPLAGFLQNVRNHVPTIFYVAGLDVPPGSAAPAQWVMWRGCHAPGSSCLGATRPPRRALGPSQPAGSGPREGVAARKAAGRLEWARTWRSQGCRSLACASMEPSARTTYSKIMICSPGRAMMRGRPTDARPAPARGGVRWRIPLPRPAMESYGESTPCRSRHNAREELGGTLLPQIVWGGTVRNIDLCKSRGRNRTEFRPVQIFQLHKSIFRPDFPLARSRR